MVRDKRVNLSGGYKELILKIDQEPAIQALVKSEARVEIVMEEFPHYESKSKREIERANQMAQGQIRATQGQFDARCGMRLEGILDCTPWFI